MKIMIEIPEEFICDYEADRFEDCFRRLIYDSGFFAGRYEKETTEMLIKAFRDAKEVIKCKDCIHCLDTDKYCVCMYWGGDTKLDGFCHKGEREKENG